jgi:hypothetical protein
VNESAELITTTKLIPKTQKNTRGHRFKNYLPHKRNNKKESL